MNILEHWFEEVWNKRNAAAIDELWVSERPIYGLANTHGGQVDSKTAFKVFHKNFAPHFRTFTFVWSRLSLKAT